MTEPEPDTLRLLEEQIELGTREVERGRVRIEVVTHERPVAVEQDLASERVEIERRPRNVLVDAMPEVREEDGALVIPVVEEELVVERRLRLREELVVRRVRTTERVHTVVSSRIQEAVVTRLAPGGSTAAGAAEPGPDHNQGEVT